jgi:secreted trypsin-like serine protease
MKTSGLREAGLLAMVSALCACSGTSFDVTGDASDSAGSAPNAPADIAQVSEPIFRGSLDTQHPEVLFLFDVAGFACTGTNIRTADGRGFLLTAGHCVTEEGRGGLVPIGAERFVVVPGDDVSQSTTVFPATQIAVEPNYDGSSANDDIAIVRYSFGNATAPGVIPALSPAEDDLAIADRLLLVGFGDTEQGGQNTQRRQVARTVGDLNEDLIAFSQEDGRGACFGDSGGPGLVTVGGQERVALTISTGVSDPNEQACATGITLGVRVSSYADFIQGVFDDSAAEAALATSNR